MLVLTRKKDEVIMIGDNVSIMVVDISEGKVRLGIEAPREVPVHRREVYDAIQRQRGPLAQPVAPEVALAEPGPDAPTDYCYKRDGASTGSPHST